MGSTRNLILLSIFFVTFSNPSFAQQVSIELGQDGQLATRSIQLLALVTVLSLAPGILIMITCFPFMVTVLAILRQGIGLQQSPPNMLLVSLALFLTYFVMEPVFLRSYEAGIQPFANNEIELEAAFLKALEPFKAFMINRIDNETFASLAELRQSPETSVQQSSPLSLMVPSFLLSEIERAFQIGFILFLPFLIIDLVVAAVLMSMGMMMVPPAIVSLPFKLAFFVVADGWTLIAGSLVQSYF